MNEPKEKITPIKNSEDHNRVVAKLEAEIEKALDWENACYKKDEIILETKKAKEWAEQEAEDWKKEAHASRRIEQEKKATKQQNDLKRLKVKWRKGVN